MAKCELVGQGLPGPHAPVASSALAVVAVVAVVALLAAGAGCGGESGASRGPEVGVLPVGPRTAPPLSKTGEGGVSPADGEPALAPATAPAPAPAPVSGDVDGDVPGEGPDWLRGTFPEDLPADTYSFGVGLDADGELARAQAVAALTIDLLGPAEARPRGQMPSVLLPGSDVERSEVLPDGRTAVLVAVPRPVFALRVQDWLDNPPKPETRDAGTPTGMLQAALDFLDFQQRGAWGCERQRTLVGSECEVTDTTMGRRQVAAVVAGLRLETALDGGIPLHPGGRALLPATVRARWRNGAGETVPWPDLPLRFEAPEGVLASDSARTDGEGHAEVAFVQSPPDHLRVRVTVDREALLGAVSELWPEVGVELGLRPVTLASGRLAVVLVESIANAAPQASDDPDGSDGTDGDRGDLAGAATGAVVETLRARGQRSARALDPDDARRLENARGPDLVAALRAIAIEARGGIDHIAIGEARSDFASRMGARSVWHEASGLVTVYDAWSGEEVTTLERSARARGIGDRHAGRNALRALGAVVGEALAELLRSRDASGAGASSDW